MISLVNVGEKLNYFNIKKNLDNECNLNVYNFTTTLACPKCPIFHADEKFEIKDGPRKYTWDSPLFLTTRRFESDVLVIDLLVKEEGHGYFITYKLIEDPGT